MLQTSGLKTSISSIVGRDISSIGDWHYSHLFWSCSQTFSFCKSNLYYYFCSILLFSSVSKLFCSVVSLANSRCFEQKSRTISHFEKWCYCYCLCFEVCFAYRRCRTACQSCHSGTQMNQRPTWSANILHLSRSAIAWRASQKTLRCSGYSTARSSATASPVSRSGTPHQSYSIHTCLSSHSCIASSCCQVRSLARCFHSCWLMALGNCSVNLVSWFLPLSQIYDLDYEL